MDNFDLLTAIKSVLELKGFAASDETASYFVEPVKKALYATSDTEQETIEQVIAASTFPIFDTDGNTLLGEKLVAPKVIENPLTPIEAKVKALNAVIEKKSLHLKVSDAGAVQSIVSLAAVKKDTVDAYRPSEGELSLINSGPGNLVPLTAENTYVFTFQSADMEVDRGAEHFARKALEKMAILAVKNRIPYITEGDYDHQWRQKNVYGQVFDASVKSGKLLYKVYIPEIPRTKNVLDSIFTGLYHKLSVGFALDPYTDYVCDLCSKSVFDDRCDHWPGMPDEKGAPCTVTIRDVTDNFEISGVAVPMQPDAHISRSADAGIAFAKSLTSISADVFTVNEFREKVLNLPALPGDQGNMLLQKNNVDTIMTGTDHKDSSQMPENELDLLIGIAPVVTSEEAPAPEAVVPEVDVNDLKDQVAALMAAVEELKTALTAKDAEEVAPEAPAVEDTPAVAAALEISLSADQLGSLVDALKGHIDTKFDSLDKDMSVINQKLDICMTANTPTLQRKLAELEASAPSSPEPKQKLWILDALTIPGNDSGGQQ